jgi:hypothetical protein
LIGIWATNPSLGDIFGQQLFSLMAGNSEQDWNKSFYILSGLIFSVGLVNLVFLREYPKQVDLEIKEMGQVLDPSAVATTPE